MKTFRLKCTLYKGPVGKVEWLIQFVLCIRKDLLVVIHMIHKKYCIDKTCDQMHIVHVWTVEDECS